MYLAGITPAAEVPGVQQNVPSRQREDPRVCIGDADEASPVLSGMCRRRGGVIIDIESRPRFRGGRLHESRYDAELRVESMQHLRLHDVKIDVDER